jgi:hypothetical protein
MARNITLTLGTPLGGNLGPNFNITANYGVVTPSTATRSELLVGKIVSVDDLATSVNVTSVGTCTNTISQNIPCSPLSPIVQAFVTASGITGSAISYVQTLYTELTVANLFNKMYAIYPFVGANANSHRYNLVNTGSYTITFNGPWVHNSDGITGNGTNTYADTGLKPNTFNTSQPGGAAFNGDLWYASASMHIYSRTDGGSGCDMGCFTFGSAQSVLFAKYNVPNVAVPNTSIYNNSGNGTAIFQPTASGFFGGSNLNTLVYNNQGGVVTGSPSGSNGIYKNGVKIIGYEQGGVSTTEVSSVNMYIGANNDGSQFPVGPSLYTNRNYAFAAIGKGLTENEMATYYTIVQNFQTSLNREV